MTEMENKMEQGTMENSTQEYSITTKVGQTVKTGLDYCWNHKHAIARTVVNGFAAIGVFTTVVMVAAVKSNGKVGVTPDMVEDTVKDIVEEATIEVPNVTTF